MKKRILLWTLLWILLTLTACGNGGKTTVDESFLMPLQIGVLEYIPLEGGLPYEDKHTYRLVYLRQGEPVTVALDCMYGKMATININLQFVCEGGNITVASPDEDVQISRGDGAILFYQEHSYKWETRIYSFEDTIQNTGWLAFNPFGSCFGHTDLSDYSMEYESRFLDMRQEPPGRAYYLTVSAKDFKSGQKLADAKLKLVQMADPDWETGKSRLFTVELVEYELGTTYKMMLE